MNPHQPTESPTDILLRLARSRKLTPETAQVLLNQGANPNENQTEPLNWAALSKNITLVEALLKGGAEPTEKALLLACDDVTDEGKCARLLVSKGANPIKTIEIAKNREHLFPLLQELARKALKQKAANRARNSEPEIEP